MLSAKVCAGQPTGTSNHSNAAGTL